MADEQTTTNDGRVKVGDYVKWEPHILGGRTLRVTHVEGYSFYHSESVIPWTMGAGSYTIVPDPNLAPAETPSQAIPSIPGMTLQEYAAIKLRVPRSGTPWLDEMIQQSRRDAFAGHAMSGSVEDYDKRDSHGGDRVLPYACKALGSREGIIARQAMRYADAMLAALATGDPK